MKSARHPHGNPMKMAIRNAQAPRGAPATARTAFQPRALTPRTRSSQNAAMAHLHSLPVVIRRLPLRIWLCMRTSGPEES